MLLVPFWSILVPLFHDFGYIQWLQHMPSEFRTLIGALFDASSAFLMLPVPLWMLFGAFMDGFQWLSDAFEFRPLIGALFDAPSAFMVASSAFLDVLWCLIGCLVGCICVPCWLHLCGLLVASVCLVGCICVPFLAVWCPWASGAIREVSYCSQCGAQCVNIHIDLRVGGCKYSYWPGERVRAPVLPNSCLSYCNIHSMIDTLMVF